MRALLQWSCFLFLCVFVEDAEASTANNLLSAAPSTADSCGVINGNSGRSLTPRDCADVARSGRTRNGVYRVWSRGGHADGMLVYCDLEKDGGGWTVIQRRGQFGNPQDYFFRRWRDYKFGFGNLQQEFWLGNDNIHSLSNQDNYVLRVNLKDHSNETRYAQYDEFFVEDETNNYRLWVELYQGDASDSMAYHTGSFFSTVDRNNDKVPTKNCAESVKGAWWFYNCMYSDLNGLNLDGLHKTQNGGISWVYGKGAYYSYREAEMKIRPKTFP